MQPDFPDDLESIQIDALVARGIYTEGAEEVGTTVHGGEPGGLSRARTKTTPSDSTEARWERERPRVRADPPGHFTTQEVEEAVERAVVAARRHLEHLRRRRARKHGTSAWADRDLDQTLFCVIDLETTGTRPGFGDEILEIGVVQLAGQELGREFSTLVNPQRPISTAAQAVHGIPQSAVVRAPRIGEVLPYVQELCRDRVLVFHNAGFDLGFLQRALTEAGRDALVAPVVDTVVLARRLMGGRCGLGSVSRRLGIDAPHPHRALPDARLTALLLVRLVDILKRAGATRLGEVPGIVARPPRVRRRLGTQWRPLLDRLQKAIDQAESLRIDYRASRGLVPLELLVQPLELVGGLYVVARDLGGGEDLQLELGRIDRVR